MHISFYDIAGIDVHGRGLELEGELSGVRSHTHWYRSHHDRHVSPQGDGLYVRVFGYRHSFGLLHTWERDTKEKGESRLSTINSSPILGCL